MGRRSRPRSVPSDPPHHPSRPQLRLDRGGCEKIRVAASIRTSFGFSKVQQTTLFSNKSAYIYIYMSGEGQNPYLKQVASLLGASGVVLGAMGAHGLHSKLVERGMLENWRTAVLYQLFHATAVLGVSALCETSSSPHDLRLKRAGQLLTLGTTMFCGSIYLLCFEIGPKKILGPATPIGGMVMISGWVMLGFC